MLTWLRELAMLLKPILLPAIGGIVGGVGSFFLLELGIRKRRERYRIAEALAAELSNIADTIGERLASEDPDEIPAYYRTPHVVFDALASRLGELPFEDVLSVTKVYDFLEELQRMPAAWRERASNAYALPHGHPFRDPEIKALEDGRKGFYELLAKMQVDCRDLAKHLRTKHSIGWRGAIPLRWRPQKKLK